MRKRIEKNLSTSSSSISFFSSTSDDSQTASSNNYHSHTRDFSDDLCQWEPATKIECWRENICADLEVFTREKIQQSTSCVPHTSPKKKSSNAALIETNKTALIENKLSNSLFFYTPEGQELHKLNQKIVAIDAETGRSYQKLMHTTRSFVELLEIRGIGNCELLFKKCGVQNAFELAKNIKTMSPMALIMFLFLIDKYPTAPQDAIIDYFKTDEAGKDCYLAFKCLNSFCYERFPTKQTMDNYTEESLFTPGKW